MNLASSLFGLWCLLHQCSWSHSCCLAFRERKWLLREHNGEGEVQGPQRGKRARFVRNKKDTRMVNYPSQMAGDMVVRVDASYL